MKIFLKILLLVFLNANILNASATLHDDITSSKIYIEPQKKIYISNNDAVWNNMDSIKLHNDNYINIINATIGILDVNGSRNNITKKYIRPHIKADSTIHSIRDNSGNNSKIDLLISSKAALYLKNEGLIKDNNDNDWYYDPEAKKWSVNFDDEPKFNLINSGDFSALNQLILSGGSEVRLDKNINLSNVTINSIINDSTLQNSIIAEGSANFGKIEFITNFIAEGDSNTNINFNNKATIKNLDLSKGAKISINKKASFEDIKFDKSNDKQITINDNSYLEQLVRHGQIIEGKKIDLAHEYSTYYLNYTTLHDETFNATGKVEFASRIEPSNNAMGTLIINNSEVEKLLITGKSLGSSTNRFNLTETTGSQTICLISNLYTNTLQANAYRTILTIPNSNHLMNTEIIVGNGKNLTYFISNDSSINGGENLKLLSGASLNIESITKNNIEVKINNAIGIDSLSKNNSLVISNEPPERDENQVQAYLRVSGSALGDERVKFSEVSTAGYHIIIENLKAKKLLAYADLTEILSNNKVEFDNIYVDPNSALFFVTNNNKQLNIDIKAIQDGEYEYSTLGFQFIPTASGQNKIFLFNSDLISPKESYDLSFYTPAGAYNNYTLTLKSNGSPKLISDFDYINFDFANDSSLAFENIIMEATTFRLGESIKNILMKNAFINADQILHLGDTTYNILEGHSAIFGNLNIADFDTSIEDEYSDNISVKLKTNDSILTLRKFKPKNLTFEAKNSKVIFDNTDIDFNNIHNNPLDGIISAYGKLDVRGNNQFKLNKVSFDSQQYNINFKDKAYIKTNELLFSGKVSDVGKHQGNFTFSSDTIFNAQNILIKDAYLNYGTHKVIFASQEAQAGNIKFEGAFKLGVSAENDQSGSLEINNLKLDAKDLKSLKINFNDSNYNQEQYSLIHFSEALNENTSESLKNAITKVKNKRDDIDWKLDLADDGMSLVLNKTAKEIDDEPEEIALEEVINEDTAKNTSRDLILRDMNYADMDNLKSTQRLTKINSARASSLSNISITKSKVDERLQSLTTPSFTQSSKSQIADLYAAKTPLSGSTPAVSFDSTKEVSKQQSVLSTMKNTVSQNNNSTNNKNSPNVDKSSSPGARSTTRNKSLDIEENIGKTNKYPSGSSIDGIEVSLEDAILSGLSAGNDYQKYGAWISPVYSIASQKKHGEMDGFKSKSAGSIFGIDTKINDNNTVGIVFTYINSNIKHKDDKIGDKSNVRSYYTTIYAFTQLSPKAFIQGSLSYGSNHIKIKDRRNYGPSEEHIFVNSKFKSNHLSLDTSVGMNKLISNNYILTPSLGFSFNKSQGFNYREVSQNTNKIPDADIKQKNLYQLDSILALSLNGISKEYANGLFIAPEIHTQVKRNLIATGNRLLVTNNNIQVSDGSKAKFHKTYYSVGTGLNIDKDNMDYGVNYDVELAKKYISHRLAFKVRINL